MDERISDNVLVSLSLVSFYYSDAAISEPVPRDGTYRVSTNRRDSGPKNDVYGHGFRAKGRYLPPIQFDAALSTTGTPRMCAR